jgi:hypothetical protein
LSRCRSSDFKRNRAGDGKRSQPCEPIRQIAEALAEEDAGLDRVGLARANALCPGVADAPCQTGRDHHLMQLALVQQVLERKRGRVESRALGDSPVSVNPSALDSNGKRRCEQPRERSADPVICDIRTFARMLEARHGRKYQFVHDRRIVKRKRAGKDPVANDPVCLSCMGDREQRCSEQPSHPSVDAFVSDSKVMGRTLPPSSGGARPSIMREHENLCLTCPKHAHGRPRPMHDGSAQRHGSWWTIENAGIGAGECDRLVRSDADARKGNRSGVDDVREGSRQRVESTALIVQIERAVMVVGVGARDSRSDTRVAVGGDWRRLIHIQRVVVD